MRNIRRDANDTLRDMEKESMISEDELKRAQEDIQELTDKHIQLVETVLKAKIDEIMTV